MNRIMRSITGTVLAVVAVCVIGLTGTTTAKAAEMPREDAAQETAGQAEVTPAEEQEVNELAMDVSEIILELSQENEQPPYKYEYMGDLTQVTGFSAEELEALVEGTGLEGLGAFYAEKEQTHGINALFLIAVAKLESGFGKSSLARNSNNLGGLKNGKGGYMKFDSKEDCIEYQATLLRDRYLSEGGKYYAGKTTKAVSKRYCEGSSSWYGQVESLMEKGYNKIIELRKAV